MYSDRKFENSHVVLKDKNSSVILPPINNSDILNFGQRELLPDINLIPFELQQKLTFSNLNPFLKDIKINENSPPNVHNSSFFGQNPDNEATLHTDQLSAIVEHKNTGETGRSAVGSASPMKRFPKEVFAIKGKQQKKY